jgi:hypothetical protein
MVLEQEWRQNHEEGFWQEEEQKEENNLLHREDSIYHILSFFHYCLYFLNQTSSWREKKLQHKKI